MTMNNNIMNMIDEIANKNFEGEFDLVYEYSIKDSIYCDDEFYDDDYYNLYYNGEELFIYDEDDYPSSLTVEICNIRKIVHVIVPFIDDIFRNAEIFKRGVEYTIDKINNMFANTDYYIDIYYSEN
jgi:hypothetical protein